MFLFSGFISYWFYVKLDIHTFNLWPLAIDRDFGLLYPIITFFLTIAIVNAINITDGLDGLAWWLSISVLAILWFLTFTTQWYLATTIIAIVLWCMIAFLWYNINPARIFMWDSGSLWLWGLVAALVYLLNIRIGIMIPFIIMFLIFWIEIGSSLLQIFRKKTFKKKLFLIAPFHHLLEKQWHAEHTIVMRFRLVQVILCAICLVMIFYQLGWWS